MDSDESDFEERPQKQLQPKLKKTLSHGKTWLKKGDFVLSPSADRPQTSKDKTRVQKHRKRSVPQSHEDSDSEEFEDDEDIVQEEADLLSHEQCLSYERAPKYLKPTTNFLQKRERIRTALATSRTEPRGDKKKRSTSRSTNGSG